MSEYVQHQTCELRQQHMGERVDEARARADGATNTATANAKDLARLTETVKSVIRSVDALREDHKWGQRFLIMQLVALIYLFAKTYMGS